MVNYCVIFSYFVITILTFILQTKKFLKCDWLRPVVFKPNLKYLHVKNYSQSHVVVKAINCA